MSISTGLAVIAALAFIISMFVALIIYALAGFSVVNQSNSANEVKHSPGSHLKIGIRNFIKFQEKYRTYWSSANVPTNELIDFYYEQ
jgi:hypothetical protein